MPPHTHPHWTSGSQEIDDEHKKLYQMVSSLGAVMKHDTGRGLDTEAVSVLCERMRLHFALEEDSATRVDPDSAAILREDHARLLQLLEQVKAATAAGDGTAARARIDTFTAELQKHDAEIDVPLFRMMSQQHDPLA